MASEHKKKTPSLGGGNVAAQAGILAAASILSRIIGLLYRSPLTAIIGDEGNGYYGTAINIYTIVLMVSSFGVPAAISKQMAQKMAVGDYKNAQKVFHCSMVYALAVGVAGSMLLYFGAGVLVPPNSVPVLQVFAPTVFLFGILGVLRGYFQANQSMVQTSVSQILEQIANAVVSILAAYLLMRTVMNADPTHKAIRGAMGSALGTGSGVLVALIFMTLVYFRYRGMFMERVHGDTEHEEEPFGPLMVETILVITPFILSSFIMNLTTSLNQTIFIKIMIQYKHWEEAVTTTLYGLFSNKAVVITNIPISIATAVAAAILPNISTSFAQGDLEETKKRSINAIRMTLVIAVPCAIGLLALARPVTLCHWASCPGEACDYAVVPAVGHARCRFDPSCGVVYHRHFLLGGDDHERDPAVHRQDPYAPCQRRHCFAGADFAALCFDALYGDGRTRSGGLQSLVFLHDLYDRQSLHLQVPEHEDPLRKSVRQTYCSGGSHGDRNGACLYFC